jgi:hypothetical protein
METERAKRVAGFVSWVGANIKGDEKGEAQVFLERIKGTFLIVLARCLVCGKPVCLDRAIHQSN